MDIRSIEIDLDTKILKINGKKTERPVKAKLPGPDGWPYYIGFNTQKGLDQEGCDELEISYKEANQLK